MKPWIQASIFLALLSIAAPVVAQPAGDTLWRHGRRCGVNSAYILCRLHSIDAPYDEIIQRLTVTENGSSLADLKNCLRTFGANARVIRTSPDKLGHCRLPAIAHIEEEVGTSGHYVILLATGPEFIEYIDGTTAEEKIIDAAEFRQRWTGYLVVLGAPPALGTLASWLVAATGLVFLGLAGLSKFRTTRPKRVVLVTEMSGGDGHGCPEA